MTATRLPGPLRHAQPDSIWDGTTALAKGAGPGPTCQTRPSSLGEYANRLDDVKTAFWRGIHRYAYGESTRRLDADIKLVVDSLWPGFMQAVQIYALSMASGAVLLGIVGALVGGGVGAVPGAMLGAELGADVATAILFFMGLKFLAEYVIDHLGVASQKFSEGLTQSWRACGDAASIDRAAKSFGGAVAALMVLLLEAAVAYVVKKGLAAGLKELNKSTAGQALAPYVKVQYWRQQLGVSDAPVPRAGIAEAIKFVDEQIRKQNLDSAEFTNEKQLKSYWKAMDFSRQVSTETLKAGTEIVGYRDPQSPYGYYYAQVGTYLDRLGIDDVTARKLEPGVQGPKQLVQREFIRYRVRRSVDVLKSTSSGVRAWDTGRPVPGGATQYFIPKAWEVLDIIN